MIKKIAINTGKVAAIIYILICVLLYFFQEKLIFAPQKLNRNHEYHFNADFQEMNLQTSDNELLNGVLFKTDSSKGLIFYLHGNGGSLDSWGEISKLYTDLHYDLFMLDYRGYGKSTGKISSQEQLFSDIQLAYDSFKQKYAEDRMIVLGYSIGTGLATKLASANHPKLLILQAPYYSLTDMMQDHYPVIPTFILKYKFATNELIKACKMPVQIFHGDNDEVISHQSSLRLKELMKPTDQLMILPGMGHNGMSDNPDYVKALKLLLSK